MNRIHNALLIKNVNSKQISVRPMMNKQPITWILK